MLSLPIAFTSAMGVFAPVFSRSVWQHVKVLLTGAVLAPGKRTISAILGRVPGACGSIQEACLATVTGAQRCRPSGHHGISEARALLVTLSQPAVRTHVACADQLP